jgi:hypothetical protein
MRYHSFIGILTVMLAITATASADVFGFEDSYGDMSMQGMFTFDENGILNGAVVAGTDNGVLDVNQHAETGNGEVLVYQSGNIEGNSGFATTAARDGSGNSGGTFASFTGGGMCFGQVSAAGVISEEFIPDPPLESSGDQLSQVGPVSSSLNGVIAGQFVGIEGNSGYASTGARNVNGASGQSIASFTDGGMIIGQVSGAGEMTSYKSYGTQTPAPVGIESTTSFSSQSGEIQAGSGSASTSGSTVHGALAESDVSFTEGSMRFRQVLWGDSTTFTEVLGLGEVAPWSNYEDIQSYQSVDSESFSTIGASSYSRLPDGSFVQVNAEARGSVSPITGQLSEPSPGSSFDVGQSAGSGLQFNPLTGSGPGSTGSFDIHQRSNEQVSIYGVQSGSAGASAGTSDGNSASMLMYVEQGSLASPDVWASTDRYDDGNLLGDGVLGDSGGSGSEAEAGYYHNQLFGTSGGFLLDTQTPRNFAYIHTTFSEGGPRESDYVGSSREGEYVSANTEEDEYRVFARSKSNIIGNPRVTTYLDIGGTGSEAWIKPGDDFPMTNENILGQTNYAEFEDITGPGDAHSSRGSYFII